MTALTAESLAELRRALDDMRDLATREGIYNGNRAVLDIVGRVEPLLDAAAERDALAALRAAAEAIARAYRARAECAEGLLVSLANRAAEDRAEIEALRSQLAERDALAARLAAAEVEARAQAERAVHAEKQADHETRVAVHLAGIVSGLRAKIERVRALHAVADCGDSTCEHCPCSTCPPRLGWPCPTIRALNEEPQP